jgi:hypothetical protein
MKAVPRGKFIALCAYIKKKKKKKVKRSKRSHSSILTAHLKALEQKE